MTRPEGAPAEADAGHPAHHRPDAPRTHALKSRGGLGRVARACVYSAEGLAAAWRHEAAFRQEVVVGLPLLLLAWWIAPGRWQAWAMCGSIVLVWIVELLNSALEALADAVTSLDHPLVKRAKDIGSAAVMTSITLAVLTWVVMLWPG